METFIRNLSVRFVNDVDSHSVMRRGTPIVGIFTKSSVRHIRSDARLKSKKVAVMRRCWVD